MPKPRLYDEDLFVRAPKGTKERIDRLRGDERQGDFVRRVLLDALADIEAGRWEPATGPKKPMK
ncbi:hypothetical protein M2352_000592 [Azospirillum fermentarium]|uniref:hypothetical protein n=1 Tax=Azospirillum fermentarium TaxID=1233114 RepID=UPI0022260BA3|nr:hypothetical protein [Azospirillum fermentarium]MCW2245001.1 hypothetical protein [Azospirillum fermentarium]